MKLSKSKVGFNKLAKLESRNAFPTLNDTLATLLLQYHLGGWLTESFFSSCSVIERLKDVSTKYSSWAHNLQRLQTTTACYAFCWHCQSNRPPGAHLEWFSGPQYRPASATMGSHRLCGWAWQRSSNLMEMISWEHPFQQEVSLDWSPWWLKASRDWRRSQPRFPAICPSSSSGEVVQEQGEVIK